VGGWTLGGLCGFFLAERTSSACGFFGCWTPDHQQLADHLDRRAAQHRTDALQHAAAFFPIVAEHAYLDQLVALERTADLGQYAPRESRLADHDDRIEVMRSGPKFPALCGGERRNDRGRLARHGRGGRGLGPIVGQFVWHAARSWRGGWVAGGCPMLQPQ